MSRFGNKQKEKKEYATEKFDTSKLMYTGTAPSPLKRAYTLAKAGYKLGKKVVKATKEKLKEKGKKKTYTGRKI